MEILTDIFNIIIVFSTVVFPGIKATLTCLSCNDSPLPRDCQYTTNCGSHEVCYTSSYVTTVGSVRHELGCMDKSKCTGGHAVRSANNLLVCSECCNVTLCNSGLCGQNGIPPLVSGSRGPICYSCDQQLKPDTCHVIKECGRDEECMLMRYESQVGHDILYRSDCVKKTVKYYFVFASPTCADNFHRYQSQTSSGNVLVGKREFKDKRVADSEHCTYKCCGTDLCNSDCTGSRVVNFNVTQTSVNPVSPIPSTTIKTTFPPMPESTSHLASTTEPCVDQMSGCENYHDYCNMDWGLSNCQKTCGLCALAVNVPCIDRTLCSQKLDACNTDWGFQYCVRSCNRCADIAQTHTQLTGRIDCTTPDTWSAGACEQYKFYCRDPNTYVKDVCKHYCGNC